jgi:hypothetical protein
MAKLNAKLGAYSQNPQAGLDLSGTYFGADDTKGLALLRLNMSNNETNYNTKGEAAAVPGNSKCPQ